MIETIDNTFQWIMTGVCTVIALYRAARLKSRRWSMLGLFSGVYLLGLTYWLMFLLFYGHMPMYSYIPDLCWYSAYLFLLLLLIYIREESSGSDSFPGDPEEGFLKRVSKVSPVLWLVPVFTIGMSIFYMQRGDYISNIIAAVLMTGLIWHSLAGLITSGKSNDAKGSNENEVNAADKNVKKNGHRMLYAVTFLFCVTEYALWTTSCFWAGDTIANPYFWFDFLLSLTFPMFIPALGKAAEE